MEERKGLGMAFNYYYGTQADQYNFIKVPKQIVQDAAFAELSVGAKMLYGLLLDRMNLSMKNGWFDEYNRVYIIYQIADIMRDIGMSKPTAIKYLKELVNFGLVEKQKRGLGLPDILFVKSFVIERDFSRTTEEIEEDIKNFTNEKSAKKPINTQKSKNFTSRSKEGLPQEVKKVDFKESRNFTCGGKDNLPAEVKDVDSSNTNINNNKFNNININNTKLSDDQFLSNHIADNGEEEKTFEDNYVDDEHYFKFTEKVLDKMRREKSEYELYMDFIKRHIDYDCLVDRYPYDKEQIEGIVELIAEIAVSNNNYIVIASNRFPKEVVKSKLLKLDYTHIEYVLECLKKNTTDVKNYKKYLLASLFNAPSTIHGYYESRVNHDMYS